MAPRWETALFFMCGGGYKLAIPAQPVAKPSDATWASCLPPSFRSQAELKAFWCNVYHCLLLHGLLVLNTPDSEDATLAFH